jgi:hypothetical protein
MRRAISVLTAALARWKRHFTKGSGDTLALYHCTRLLLACPSLARLPRIVGYPERNHPSPDTPHWRITDSAVGIAWQVLGSSESCAVGSEPYSSIWLPAVVFLAALAFAKHAHDSGALRQGSSNARLLSSFAAELIRLRWPCCATMAERIQSLGRAPAG